MLCVLIIHKWRDLQFKVDSERHFFVKLFMGILFYAQEKKYFSYFVLMFGLGLEPYYLLDHGDLFISTHCNKYKYNADIKLIPFEICLIHKPIHLGSKLLFE